MPKLPKNNLLIVSSSVILIVTIAVVGFFIYSAINNNSVPTTTKSGKVVATVSGTKIYQSDYDQHERILNGPKRYLKLTDPKTVLFTQDEVMADLITTTKMEVGAKRDGFYPTSSEVDQKQQDYLNQYPGQKNVYPLYGWTQDDVQRNFFIITLKAKVEDNAIKWRDVELLHVRWDVLNPPADQVATDKANSKLVLQKFQGKFSSGEDVEKLAGEVKQDQDLLKYFKVPNVVEYLKYDNNPLLESIQRVDKQNSSNNVLTDHILGLALGTKADLYCSDAACYLIRVLRGGNGKFDTVEDWLKSI